MSECYRVQEIDRGVWAIEEGKVRMFLVEGEHRALLLDAGFGQGDLKALLARLTNKPVTLALTHADGDHTGGYAKLEGEVFLHPAEFERFTQKAGQRALRPLWEGEQIDLGGRRLLVMHIPGHTPGSIALLDQQTGNLFAGDSVQTGPIYMFGPGRNLPALVVSMERLESFGGKIRSILPCHGALPLPASYIQKIREGAVALLTGKLEGKEPRDAGLPCREYICGDVSFYA